MSPNPPREAAPSEPKNVLPASLQYPPEVQRFIKGYESDPQYAELVDLYLTELSEEQPADMFAMSKKHRVMNELVSHMFTKGPQEWIAKLNDIISVSGKVPINQLEKIVFAAPFLSFCPHESLDMTAEHQVLKDQLAYIKDLYCHRRFPHAYELVNKKIESAMPVEQSDRYSSEKLYPFYAEALAEAGIFDVGADVDFERLQPNIRTTYQTLIDAANQREFQQLVCTAASTSFDQLLATTTMNADDHQARTVLGIIDSLLSASPQTEAAQQIITHLEQYAATQRDTIRARLFTKNSDELNQAILQTKYIADENDKKAYLRTATINRYGYAVQSRPEGIPISDVPADQLLEEYYNMWQPDHHTPSILPYSSLYISAHATIPIEINGQVTNVELQIAPAVTRPLTAVHDFIYPRSGLAGESLQDYDLSRFLSGRMTNVLRSMQDELEKLWLQKKQAHATPLQ